MSQEQDRLKLEAARHAVGYVEPGMVIGLGSGSTAALFVRELARKLQAGSISNLIGIATSEAVALLAKELGFPLADLDKYPQIDITVDGADEVDPDLNLIKGGGGALLREKIVAQSSVREVIVVDDSKLSPRLGTKWQVPVEVVPFGWRTHLAHLTELGATARLRTAPGGAPFVTDERNLIIDCQFGLISDPRALDRAIKQRAGIVETGLFVEMAHEVIVASKQGIKILTR